MPGRDCLDNLIECVWRVVQADLLEKGNIFPCKDRCIDCLKRLVGPDHYYTHCFQDLGTDVDRMNLLAAVGVLTAAKEEVAKYEPDRTVLDCPDLEMNSTTCDG